MLDYEAEYNNRRRVPESSAIALRWQAASAAYARSADAEHDQPYGQGERQRYDLFRARRPRPALIVYIHGGYWQRGDRKDYAFVAEAFNAAGIDVALPSYSLCPNATVVEIIAEMRLFLAALWRKTGMRPVVVGHSAGGHLAAALIATDWKKTGTLRDAPIAAACAISGIFELEPLVGTSLNEALRLDAAAAIAASPLLWPPPARGQTLIAAVGELESSEFHRQSRCIAARWRSAGLDTDYLPVTGTNHFTIVDQLVDPASRLFARILTLVQA
jgi:arylformamidase